LWFLAVGRPGGRPQGQFQNTELPITTIRNLKIVTIIPLLILASLALGGTALAGFIWAVKAGQFEDTSTPALRILTDEREKMTNRKPPI